MEPFYGEEIDAQAEQRKVHEILSKYRLEPVSDGLRKKIHDDLARAKAAREIAIPFKVVLRKDPAGVHRDFIEVVLDTKV